MTKKHIFLKGDHRKTFLEVHVGPKSKVSLFEKMSAPGPASGL